MNKQIEAKNPNKTALLAGFFTLALCLAAGSLFAEDMSGNGLKLRRSAVNAGGETSISAAPKYNLTLAQTDYETSYSVSATAANSVYPGIINQIAHPDAILNMSGAEIGQAQIQISWTTPNFEDGNASATGTYIVKWSTNVPLNDELNFATATLVNQAWTPLASGQADTRILSNLPTGTSVYVAIKAKDTAGNTAYASSGTASWQGVFVSSAPMGPVITATAVGTKSIKWDWETQMGNTEVFISTIVETSSAPIFSKNTTTYTSLPVLPGPNQLVTFKMKALNKFWESAETVRSTYTLAEVPGKPKVIYISGLNDYAFLTIDPVNNPAHTEYAIFVEVSNPRSKHNNSYVPASGDMDSASATPIWQTASDWKANFKIQGFDGFMQYSIYVIARNADGIASQKSLPEKFFTYPKGPSINFLSGLKDKSWTNVMTNSFIAINSAHYHYDFNSKNFNPFESLDVIPDDNSVGTAFFSTETITISALYEGQWNLFVIGDLHGYMPDPSTVIDEHLPLGTKSFQINVDTTLPVISHMSAQFSPTDTSSISDGKKTSRSQVYFKWYSDDIDLSKDVNAAKRVSPLQSYEINFSTGLQAGTGNSAIISASAATAYFRLDDPKAGRADNTYLFTVRALDAAGNWGPISTFTYVYQKDIVNPVPTIKPISPVRLKNNGPYMSVRSSSVTVTFDKDMLTETFSASNIRLLGLRDNMAVDQVPAVSVAVSTQYDPATRTLIIWAANAQDLKRGWLYELTLSQSITDIGNVGLAQDYTAEFETLLDPSIQNRIKAADGETLVDLPAGSMTEDVSVGVGVIQGGIAQAPSRKSGSPAWDTPLYSSMESISSANQKIKTLLGAFAQPVTIRDFNAIREDGTPVKSRFNDHVQITMPYLDKDNDGYVDDTSPRIRVKDLQVFVLDETNNVWQKLPNGEVDTNGKKSLSSALHFSIYAVFGVPNADVTNSYAYPVPFKPSEGHSKITFALLPSEGSIRIFTVSGQLVKTISFNDPLDGKLEWDVKNEDGQNLGSDVYLYIIQSGENKKTGKIMVIR